MLYLKKYGKERNKVIKAKNIVKCFEDVKALDNLSINVKKGSVYGLVGPNGAGKTTLIKTLLGIYKMDSGELEIGGVQDVNNEELKQRVVYISDDLYFYPTYSIKEMAKFYKSIYKNWDDETFEKLKAVFNIDEKRKVKKLSKGMQKQVAFWLGLCVKPDVMILDEPLDGLDPVMRRSTMKLVLSEVEEREMTVLVSSHNLRELEDVCDYVGIMHKGKIVIEKALDDIKGNIHKIQVAFKGGMPEELSSKLDILKSEVYGSVYNIIVKGENAEEIVRSYEPLICDVIPLSLEEVFIYELGGMGYEFEII